MSPANELHGAVEDLLKELNEELITTVRQRDAATEHRERLANRAIEIEARLDVLADLEMRVRRMP